MRFVTPKDGPWEAAFQQYLTGQWQELQSALSDAMASNATPRVIQDLRISLYVFAVGLVTYGRIDVIPFLIQNIPAIGKLPQGARVVLELLPIPASVHQQGGWEAVAQWVEANAASLRWDSEQERFVFQPAVEQQL